MTVNQFQYPKEDFTVMSKQKQQTFKLNYSLIKYILCVFHLFMHVNNFSDDEMQLAITINQKHSHSGTWNITREHINVGFRSRGGGGCISYWYPVQTLHQVAASSFGDDRVFLFKMVLFIEEISPVSLSFGEDTSLPFDTGDKSVKTGDSGGETVFLMFEFRGRGLRLASSFFHFILLFWNQIFIWRSVRFNMAANSILRGREMYLLKWNSFSSSSSWPLV